MDFGSSKFNPFAKTQDDDDGEDVTPRHLDVNDDTDDVWDSIGDPEDYDDPDEESGRENIYDDDLEEKNPDELRAFLNANGEFTEHDQDLKEQIDYNRYMLTDSGVVDDISLIDEPDDNFDAPPKFPESTVDLAMAFVMALAVLAGVVSIIVAGTIYVKNNQASIAAEQNYVAPQRNNPMGNGVPYDQQSREESSEESSQPTTSAQESDDDVSVPDNGSLVRYEITTQGDISSVSLSYIDGEGKSSSESSVSLPWSTSVGMEEGYTPVLKANSAGRGTVTCSVAVDGEVVTRDTNSGDSPSVDCESS